MIESIKLALRSIIDYSVSTMIVGLFSWYYNWPALTGMDILTGAISMFVVCVVLLTAAIAIPKFFEDD